MFPAPITILTFEDFDCNIIHRGASAINREFGEKYRPDGLWVSPKQYVRIQETVAAHARDTAMDHKYYYLCVYSHNGPIYIYANEFCPENQGWFTRTGFGVVGVIKKEAVPQEEPPNN